MLVLGLGLSIVLSIALAASLLSIFLLHRDIRRLRRTLAEVVSIETNTLLTTQTFDREITALAQQINVMLARNRRNAYELTRTEAALKRAVTNIAHDLRTPLTSAMGYIQMMESPGADENKKARYRETVRGRLEALSVLMNSLFEFAQIIEGSTVYDIQPVNIGNIVRDALSAAYGELESRKFSVEAHIPETPVIGNCDANALRRVMQNLIKNACIHGKELLRVRVENKNIYIENRVHNPETLDTKLIFERFYTADAARISKNTGLGLAISKELTERMGGAITAAIEEDRLVMRIALK